MRTRHRRVVLFLGAGSLLTGKREIFVLLEFLPGGDLRMLLDDRSKALEWPARLRIASDIAEGMSFLHSRSLVHRDLKSPNILLDNQMRAKIADFGLSRFTTSKSEPTPDVRRSLQSQNADASGMMTSRSGTVHWMAVSDCHVCKLRV